MYNCFFFSFVLKSLVPCLPADRRWCINYEIVSSLPTMTRPRPDPSPTATRPIFIHGVTLRVLELIFPITEKILFSMIQKIKSSL
jgi:hypothetical protein